MPRERGDHSVALIREGQARAANQADLRVSQCPAIFCYKICSLKSLTAQITAISGALRHLCRSRPAITNGWFGPNFADLS